MVALYLAADVMLVTALRDGMNLVAKEYVATPRRRRRRARAQRVHRRVRRAAPGAADQPARHRGAQGGRSCRPIAMPRRERARRMRALRKRVLTNDVARWSAVVPRCADPQRPRRPPAAEPAREPPLTARKHSITDDRDRPSLATCRSRRPDRCAAPPRIAHRRLLLALDFDGTLAPFVDKPKAARTLPEAEGRARSARAAARTPGSPTCRAGRCRASKSSPRPTRMHS